MHPGLFVSSRGDSLRQDATIFNELATCWMNPLEILVDLTNFENLNGLTHSDDIASSPARSGP